jgi:hypothetical protein
MPLSSTPYGAEGHIAALLTGFAKEFFQPVVGIKLDIEDAGDESVMSIIITTADQSSAPEIQLDDIDLPETQKAVEIVLSRLVQVLHALGVEDLHWRIHNPDNTHTDTPV